MLRLLPLLLIACLVAAAPAAAAAPRCAKHTVVIGPKQQPRACLPKTLPAANPIVLKSLVGEKPNRRLGAIGAPAVRGPGGAGGPRAPGGGQAGPERRRDGAAQQARRQREHGLGEGQLRAELPAGQRRRAGQARRDHDVRSRHGRARQAVLGGRHDAQRGDVDRSRRRGCEGRDVRRRVPRRGVDQVRRRDRVHGQGAQAQSHPHVSQRADQEGRPGEVRPDLTGEGDDVPRAEGRARRRQGPRGR